MVTAACEGHKFVLYGILRSGLEGMFKGDSPRLFYRGAARWGVPESDGDSPQGTVTVAFPFFRAPATKLATNLLPRSPSAAKG